MLEAYQKTKEWRSRPENKGKRAEEARRWREKHPDTYQEIRSRYREANLEKIRARDMEAKREYRLTPEYKEAQRLRQLRFRAKREAEQIAIAGRPKPENCEICLGNEYRIVWDHCHSHGHFRGWICDRCNRVLGLVKDNQELLRGMATYLEDTKGG